MARFYECELKEDSNIFAVAASDGIWEFLDGEFVRASAGPKPGRGEWATPNELRRQRFFPFNAQLPGQWARRRPSTYR